MAAARRKAAMVIGDGSHNIRELVDLVNTDPRRGKGHQNVMSAIKLDESTLQLLSKKAYSPETILRNGEKCLLKTTSNLSTGGTATDVTDEVHPTNIALFNRIARVIGLDICGIDVMAKDLTVPIANSGGAIIEVNAAPGFRMHLQPSEGTPRNVAAPVIEMLYAANAPTTIPIIGITGTNGKTTTTFLLAYICRQQGLSTGHTTTEGVFINGDQVMDGDCSGPASAQLVLRDSSVEIAVLECARGGILRAALGFDECDIAVITNIAEDHLGLGGINTLKELARVKAVVAESVKPSGYAVLNADDDVVFEMRNNITCNFALYSLRCNNPRVLEHCAHGGIAAFVENNYIVIARDTNKMQVAPVASIPITFNGTAKFNVYNVLAAVLAAYLQNIPIEWIKASLLTFRSSPDLVPGRMNIFDFNDFTVMVDYAHNPHGVQALGNYVDTIQATEKLAVVTGVGDRRDEDLVALGKGVGKIFDRIIIRRDDYLWGRDAEEIFNLLSQGIVSSKPSANISCIPDEEEAVRTAIKSATPGSFIVVFVDKVSKAIEVVKACKLDEEEKNLLQKKLSTVLA